MGEGKTGEIVNLEGKVCGEVTSVSGGIGLGYLKRGADSEGLTVLGIVISLRP